MVLTNTQINKFVNYKLPRSTMAFVKDKEMNIWLACTSGLYIIDKEGIVINVMTYGPWK